MTLTFVVPTIAGRESLLSRCLWSITTQPGAAQVLVVDGDGKLGDKVNAAFAVIDTEYVTVVDDDDYVNLNYLACVLPLLGQVDYVGFKYLELSGGMFDNVVASQGDYTHWGRRTRGPVTKGVIRTSIAQTVKFGNDYKADRKWSDAMRPLIGTCGFVDRILYVHDWWPAASAFVGDEAGRDVGQWPHLDVQRITV